MGLIITVCPAVLINTIRAARGIGTNFKQIQQAEGVNKLIESLSKYSGEYQQAN